MCRYSMGNPKKMSRFIEVCQESRGFSHERFNIIPQKGNQMKQEKKEWNIKNGKHVGSIIKEKYCVEGTNLNNILSDKVYRNNTSGVKGVYWSKTRRKWTVQITLKGKTHTLGRFDKKEDAILVRKEAEKEYFGKYIAQYRKATIINRTE